MHGTNNFPNGLMILVIITIMARSVINYDYLAF